MSIVPTTTLPQCTRTAVIDLLFMRKYALTHTQMLVMYHMLMLKNWAKEADDEFYIILSLVPIRPRWERIREPKLPKSLHLN